MCTAAQSVEVDINASSNKALLSGRLEGVTVKAASLVYNGVAISGGIALYTDEIIITSANHFSRFARTPQLAKPFSVSVRATLTERDLNSEGPMRDAMQVLLTQAVTTALSGATGRALPVNIGGLACSLESIQLLDAVDNRVSLFPFWPFRRARSDRRIQGKLVMNACATLSSGRKLKFSIRSGISVVNDGRIIKLADPYLLWNGLSIPVVTIDTVGFKLDATSKITNVRIEKGRLSADGITVVSPQPRPSRRLPLQTRR